MTLLLWYKAWYYSMLWYNSISNINYNKYRAHRVVSWSCNPMQYHSNIIMIQEHDTWINAVYPLPPMVPTPMHCVRALVIQYCMISGIIAVILMLCDTDIIGIIAMIFLLYDTDIYYYDTYAVWCRYRWLYCYDTHAVWYRHHRDYCHTYCFILSYVHHSLSLSWVTF